MKFTACAFLVSFLPLSWAAPVSEASLAADRNTLSENDLLKATRFHPRHKRSFRSIDTYNTVNHLGPIDAYLGPVTGHKDDSKDIDRTIQALGREVAKAAADPGLDVGGIQEQVAQLEDQLKELVPPPTPPAPEVVPAPVVDVAEAAAQAQEVVEAQASQQEAAPQVDPGTAADAAAELAEQHPQPDPPSVDPAGAQDPNEDGDGHGNNGNQDNGNNGNNGNSYDPPSPPEPPAPADPPVAASELGNGGGGGGGGGDPPAPPDVPQADSPFNGGGVDEDTKS